MVNTEIIVGLIAIGVLGAVFIPLAFDGSIGGVDFIDCDENEILKYEFVNQTLAWVCGVDETTVTEGVVGTFANENTEFRPHLVQGTNVQDPIKDFGEYAIRVLEYLPFEFGETSWDYLIPQDYELGEDLEFIVYWIKEDGLPDQTIVPAYNEQSTACQSTTTTASPLNIMAGVEFNFTANNPYLLMVNTAWGNDENHEGVSVIDVRHGSTIFEGSRMQNVIHTKTDLPCNENDDFYKYFWWTVYTPNATEALEDLTLNVDNNDNLNFDDLGAIVYDDTTFTIIDLSVLTEDVDYFFDINNTKSDILNSWATDSSATVTFTPLNNTDYLVLGTNLNNQTSKDYDLEVRLLTSGSQSDTLPHIIRQGEAQTTSTLGVDAFENDLMSFARTFNLENVTTTFTVQTQVEDGETNPDNDQPVPDQRLSNSIFVLNLDVFSDHAFVWKPDIQLLTGDDFTHELATISVNATTDDKRIFVIGEVGIPDPQQNFRMQLNNVDVLIGETLQSYDWEDKIGGGDIARWTLTTVTDPVLNGTHTIDIDGGKAGGRGDKEVEQVSLTAFLLESFEFVQEEVPETVCMEVRLMSVDVGEDMSSSIIPTHTEYKEVCASTIGGADILRTFVFNFNATENPFEPEEVGILQLKRHSDNSTSDDYDKKVFVLFGELQWVVDDP